MESPFDKYRLPAKKGEDPTGGDLSELEWMRLKPPYDVTRHGIYSLIVDEYPCVKSAWVDDEPGSFSVRVEYKWWAQLIPFYCAAKTTDLALRIRRLCPPGIIFYGASFT